LASSNSGSKTRPSKYYKGKATDEKTKNSLQKIKLPKIDNKKTKKSHANTGGLRAKHETSKLGHQIGGRRKKFSNVKSSGYGKPSKKATNPSATSTITEKTSKTVGTSSQISSKTLPKDDAVYTSKHTKAARSKKLQSIRREPTLTKLPSIR